MWSIMERPHMNDWMLMDPRGRICCLGDSGLVRRLAERLNASRVKPVRREGGHDDGRHADAERLLGVAASDR
jgi:hypothetical protein